MYGMSRKSPASGAVKAESGRHNRPRHGPVMTGEGWVLRHEVLDQQINRTATHNQPDKYQCA